MIDEILKHLYISDASSVLNEKGQTQMKKLQITHVLTVSAMCIPPHLRIDGIEYKFLFAMDMVTQDIFADDLLNSALQFIEEAIREGGNVLVHCEVGMSRSVFVVMAYLMKTYHWSVEKALARVRSSRPIAYPNEGFLRQLKIFQNLGYKADLDSVLHCAEYRQWCTASGNIFQMSSLTATSKGDEGTAEGKKIEFRCRKCRRALFYDIHVLKHASKKEGAEGGTTYFDGNLEGECGFGFLLTPMKWMDLSAYEGKIFCPTCNEKLGHYVWGGRVCLGVDGKKCGASVRPWVHIHKGKVDMVSFTTEAGKIEVTSKANVVNPPVRVAEPSSEEKASADKIPQVETLTLDDNEPKIAGGYSEASSNSSPESASPKVVITS